MSNQALTYDEIISDPKAHKLCYPVSTPEEIVRLATLLANEAYFETHHGHYPSEEKPDNDIPDSEHLWKRVLAADVIALFTYDSCSIPIVVEDTYLSNIGYTLDWYTGCILNFSGLPEVPHHIIVTNSFTAKNIDSAEYNALICHEVGHYFCKHTASPRPKADLSTFLPKMNELVNKGKVSDDDFFILTAGHISKLSAYSIMEMEANIYAYKLYHDLKFDQKYNMDFLTALENVVSHSSISTKTRIMTQNMLEKLRGDSHSDIMSNAAELCKKK